MIRFIHAADAHIDSPLTLYDIAHRSSTKKDSLDKVDWQKFYEAVKDFLK